MNHRRFAKFCGTLLLPLLYSAVHAATIVAETGRDAFGWAARTDEFGIVSWSQTNAYHDVSIYARLYSVAAADKGTAYLMTRVGPGTTVADQVATASITFPMGSHPSDVLLFSGLTLGPGTYYLIVAGGTNYWSAWYGTDQSTITTDNGVTHHGNVYVFQPAAYPPASAFHDHPYMRYIFSVSGHRPGENRAPIANAGTDQEVNCAGGITTVTLDGRASSDPDGDAMTYSWWESGTQLGLGAMLDVGLVTGRHSIDLVVTDPAGNAHMDTVLVNVADIRPPVVKATAFPAVLWPPNGRMVPVSILAKVRDRCDADAAARIVRVESDSRDLRLRDWEITGPLTLNLRARRSPRGGTTIYRVIVEATDASGNTTRAAVPVTVRGK